MSEELLKEVGASLRMILRHLLSEDKGGGVPSREISSQLKKLDGLLGPYVAPEQPARGRWANRPPHNHDRNRDVRGRLLTKANDKEHTFIHEVEPAKPFVDRPPPRHFMPQELKPVLNTNELMERAKQSKAQSTTQPEPPTASMDPKPKKRKNRVWDPEDIYAD